MFRDDDLVAGDATYLQLYLKSLYILSLGREM